MCETIKVTEMVCNKVLETTQLLFISLAKRQRRRTPTGRFLNLYFCYDFLRTFNNFSTEELPCDCQINFHTLSELFLEKLGSEPMTHYDRCAENNSLACLWQAVSCWDFARCKQVKELRNISHRMYSRFSNVQMNTMLNPTRLVPLANLSYNSEYFIFSFERLVLKLKPFMR